MSTLIPNRQLKDVQAMSGEELRLMPSCEVYDGGVDKDENYVYTHVSRNPYDGIVADNIRTKAEYLCLSNNSLYPPQTEMPSKVLSSKVFACDECGASFTHKIALSGHKRTHAKEEVMA